VLVAASIPAAADTFARAEWQFGVDGDSHSGPRSAEIVPQSFNLDDAFIGAVSASAHADYLTLGSSAAFSTTNSTPTAITEAIARAFAETMDELAPHGLPAGSAGFLVYKATVSGTNTATLSPTHVGDHVDPTA